MKRLSVFVGFLGLLACSDASGKAEEKPKTTPVKTTVEVAQPSANWVVDKSKSSLSFSGDQSGTAFTGTFDRFEAVINFDPKNLENAKVMVSIDMNSADANDAERTDALPGKEWFNVKKFPVAKFEASNFKHLSGDKFEAKGNLTIKDTTQAIVLPFTLKIENGRAAMDAKVSLNRSIYKIGTGMWASKDWVGHEITVNIHLAAQRNK